MFNIFQDNFKEDPYWWDDAPPPKLTVDEIPKKVDVVVIGSGYAGLSCAIELARAGTEILVIDRVEIGSGASSRAGGLTSGRAGVSKLINLEATVGDRRANEILEEADQAYTHLQDFIKFENIACDFHHCGRFMGAHSRRAYDKIAFKMIEYNKGKHQDFEMVTQAEQSKIVNSDYYKGGMFNRNAGTIHPAKYHSELVRLSIEAGVKLLSNTLVKKIISTKSGKEVFTNNGNIKAESVMIGTGGYTDKLSPYHRKRIIPMSSTLIATEKIGRDRVNEILPLGCPVIDTKRIISYARRSPDGESILFGGRARFTPISARKSTLILHETMAKIFPSLTNTQITHSWTGLMAFTFDFLPKLGVQDGNHYALACNGGSGIVMMSWLGKRAAQNILGKSNSVSAFQGLKYKTHPLYTGLPWFVPMVGTWYRFRDWAEEKIDNGR